jgi:NADPH-dependent 2,4-dienoyl-CoA reductase/sulfur reductase-like enzyme
MIIEKRFDVLVLGGGPAGLAAALAAKVAGASVAIIEREQRLGGILKQCVHDGFGLLRFGEQLAGPEYALRFARQIPGSGIQVFLETFVHSARRIEPSGGAGSDGAFSLDCVNKAEGALRLSSKALVLATGCRERTDRQVFIQGERPAGIMTAGLAQHLVNIEGLLPGRRAVILGSGDIGLIMARRLTLEGMEIEGVYEIKSEPSGLSRNLRQCLDDFDIPLHLSTTVTEVFGKRRVEAVSVAQVDGRGTPIEGTGRRIDCDTLVLSVGLIPENEIALSLGLSLDPATKGPRVDQTGASDVDGVYVCGNALHVNDLVDYVSESGETAGAAAASFALSGGEREPRRLVRVKAGPGFLYAVPQFVDASKVGRAAIYFRSAATVREGAKVEISCGDKALLAKSYAALRPPEMERLEIETSSIGDEADEIFLSLERKGGR